MFNILLSTLGRSRSRLSFSTPSEFPAGTIMLDSEALLLDFEYLIENSLGSEFPGTFPTGTIMLDSEAVLLDLDYLVEL